MVIIKVEVFPVEETAGRAFNVCPSFVHITSGAGIPTTMQLKIAFSPAVVVLFCGLLVNSGLTRKRAYRCLRCIEIHTCTVVYIPNRKHFPCFHRVMVTRVKFGRMRNAVEARAAGKLLDCWRIQV